jgi:hypothetical protein
MKYKRDYRELTRSTDMSDLAELIVRRLYYHCSRFILYFNRCSGLRLMKGEKKARRHYAPVLVLNLRFPGTVSFSVGALLAARRA